MHQRPYLQRFLPPRQQGQQHGRRPTGAHGLCSWLQAVAVALGLHGQEAAAGGTAGLPWSLQGLRRARLRCWARRLAQQCRQVVQGVQALQWVGVDVLRASSGW